MRKISGIIPSSPRITTVDLRNSGRSRPGMPGFGRPTGVSSLGTEQIDKYSTVRLSDTLDSFDVGRGKPLSEREQKAKIISDMTNGFFMKKAKSYTPDIPKQISLRDELYQAPQLEISTTVQATPRDPLLNLDTSPLVSTSVQSQTPDVLMGQDFPLVETETLGPVVSTDIIGRSGQNFFDTKSIDTIDNKIKINEGDLDPSTKFEEEELDRLAVGHHLNVMA